MRDAPSAVGGGRATLERAGWLRLLAAVGVVAGALALASGPAAATPVAPSGRVTFGVEPVAAAGAAVRPNFSFSATPGGVVNDSVAAVNYSSTPLSLQIYPTDAVETSGGGFGLLPASQKPTGIGTWIALAPGSSTVQVPAETTAGPGKVVIPFVVHIPLKATPGDHVGGIIASLQTAGSNGSGQRIVLDQRVGTRVFVLVAGPLRPQLTVTDLEATYDGTANPLGKGQVRITYQVNNAGNVDVGVDQSVAVAGAFSTERVQPASIPLLLPGATVAEHAVVSGVWPGVLLRQRVIARPIALPGSTVPGLVPATASTTVSAVPWTLLAIIIVLVLAIVLVWRRRKRRVLQRQGDEAGPKHVRRPARELAGTKA
jgi:hypothetical protein